MQGNKGVFYTPITDVSGKPMLACKADTKTGKFYCPALSGFFGAGGNTFLQSPYVECYDSRNGEWKNCNTAYNYFLKGDSIKIRPHIYSSGNKQCLSIKMTGMALPMIKIIPENSGPTITPEYILGTVTEELLGGTSGSSIKYN